jgi:hypothetical protein
VAGPEDGLGWLGGDDNRQAGPVDGNPLRSLTARYTGVRRPADLIALGNSRTWMVGRLPLTADSVARSCAELGAN